MNLVNTLKWYNFFNNKSQQKQKVLIKDQIIYPQNIIIAKKNKTIWLYAKFISLKQFINYFLKTKKQDQTFYVILTHPTRYLYLDIDYKLSSKISIKKHNLSINDIIFYLQKFTRIYGYQFGINYYQSKWLIWDGSRFDNNKKFYYDKFSLHIIDAGNIMYYLDIKNFADAFNKWLIKNYSINPECKIDTNIYHNKYQAWRLPYNHNGNINSVLKLYKNDINLHAQMSINIMNDIKMISKPYLSINYNMLKCKQKHNDTFYTVKNKQTITKRNIINIPNIYFYDNTTAINYQTLNTVQQIFKINDFDNFKNNEFIIHNHYCPILKNTHKRNSGRLAVLHIPKVINTDHCIYTCMDENCQNKIKQLYISLSTSFIRPWIIYGLQQLNNTILQELDIFINLLLKNNILLHKSNAKQQILKQNKIRLNKSNYIFSTYVHNNIIHEQCKNNDISISYKDITHPQIHYGRLTLYCRICKLFINMKNKQLIYR